MIRIIATLAAVTWCALIYLETRQVSEIPPHESVSEMLEKLFSLAEKTAKKYDIAGGYVGVIEGDAIYGKAVGFSDIDAGRPIESDTAFNIGSVSKPISAWGVLALAQDGHIDLDAPVNHYLKKWTLPESSFDHDKVTIRRLLRHTAGINIHGYAGYESLDGPISQPFRPIKYAPKTLVESSQTNYPIRVMRKPGSKRVYSGGGYAILQMLIEDISGMTFSDYMNERILMPLEMHHSSFAPDRLPKKAHAYNIQGEVLPDMQFLALAPAGLYTSGGDIGIFLRAQMSNGAAPLTSEYMAMILAPTEANARYGMSYTRHPFENGVLYGHGGNNSSWHAQIYFIPQTRQGFYFLTNSTTGAQWEIDLSCAWKSWVLKKSAKAVCADSLSLVQQISFAAAVLGLIAISVFARAMSRIKQGTARVRLLPRARGIIGTLIKYTTLILLMVVTIATFTIFFTGIVYWREGVTFLDEIPIYEARYFVIAVCAFLLAMLINTWLTKRYEI